MISRVKAVTKERLFLSAETADRAIGIIFFLWATALSAYVYIPIPGTPVPITLQTFFVLLAAALLRRSDGLAAMSGYVALGALGLPFFAAGRAGLGYFFGPTAGYLVGFVLAVAVIKRVMATQHSERAALPTLIVAMVAGIAVIYACGITWLAAITRISLINAWRAGALPFIAADAFKLATAAVIAQRYQAWRGRITC